MWETLLHIQHQLLGIFYEFFEACQEFTRQSAIDQAVIKRESQGHDWSCYNRALLNNSFLLESAHGENGDFGMIDDGRTAAATEAANIVQGEGTAAEFR